MTNILMSCMALDKKWGRLEFSKYIKPSDRVVIIPFPFFDCSVDTAAEWDMYFGSHGEFYDYFTEPFEFFGIPAKSIRWINYFTDTPQSAKNKIKSSDIILLSDGIPRQMLQTLNKLELTEVLKNYKKLIIGIGCGAVIQLSDYQVEPCSLWDFQYFKGLRIIDNIGIEISFDEFDFPNISLRKFLEEKKKPIYALHNEGAVIIEGDKINAVGDVDIINSLDNLEKGIEATQLIREHIRRRFNNSDK